MIRRTQWSDIHDDASKLEDVLAAKAVCDYLTYNDVSEKFDGLKNRNKGKVEYCPPCFYSRVCDNCDCSGWITSVNFVGRTLFPYQCRKKRENEHKNTVV